MTVRRALYCWKKSFQSLKLAFSLIILESVPFGNGRGLFMDEDHWEKWIMIDLEYFLIFMYADMVDPIIVTMWFENILLYQDSSIF